MKKGTVIGLLVSLVLILGIGLSINYYAKNCMLRSYGWATSDKDRAHTFVFDNMKMCPGEYYLSIDEVKPKQELKLTTSTSEFHTTFINDEPSKMLTEGDKVPIDKSIDTILSINTLKDTSYEAQDQIAISVHREKR